MMKCLTVGDLRRLTRSLSADTEVRVYAGDYAPGRVVHATTACTNGKHGYLRKTGDKGRRHRVFILVEKIEDGDDTRKHIEESDG